VVVTSYTVERETAGSRLRERRTGGRICLLEFWRALTEAFESSGMKATAIGIRRC